MVVAVGLTVTLPLVGFTVPIRWRESVTVGVLNTSRKAASDWPALIVVGLAMKNRISTFSGAVVVTRVRAEACCPSVLRTVKRNV